jgi:uncharacterized membrane protein
VVMPGIKRLDDGAFIRSFQSIDRVIQNSQPLFMLAWIGSALSVLAAAVTGLWELSGVERSLVAAAALVHTLGVQAPTALINVPLNNQLQRLDPETMDGAARKRARDDFEIRWNRWNLFRTACASVASVVLMILLLRV